MQELSISDTFSCELVRLVLAQKVTMTSSASSGSSSSAGDQIYQQYVVREQDAIKMKKKYTQLMANHQQLRKDYQKLIGKWKIINNM